MQLFLTLEAEEINTFGISTRGFSLQISPREFFHTCISSMGIYPSLVFTTPHLLMSTECETASLQPTD